MMSKKSDLDHPWPIAEPASSKAHTPSQADGMHIALAKYRRKQADALDQMMKLRAERLSQPQESSPKRKRKAVVHVKTKGFGRWS